MTADEIIEALELQPHPEGGFYRQTWELKGEERSVGTCIYFLLTDQQRSHWHKVDAVEIWHFYAGAPVILRTSKTDAGPANTLMLGPDLASGQRPQGIADKHDWQSAETTGAWSLVGCTVSPGFRFEGFELAEPGFDIPD
ncbi:MAG: cupin domain-containing protein [Boseongicola sp.]|nr:cupin domain-containing protein [Boseongicola sp.]